MTIKTTYNGAAAVNTEYFWIPVSDTPPPQGVKLLLIDLRSGVAHLSIYRKQDRWSHWQALPRFKDRA